MSQGPRDRERNRLSGRASRYVRVGAGVGGAAARIAGAALFGRDLADQRNAEDLVATLGGLKGPLMKVVQLAATIPDLLPPEFAAELQKLQASAPPMGPAFVRRRMMAELGRDWEKRFRSFDRTPAAAASLGQVHKAVGRDGRALACKLQYPDMKSAVEADLRQLGVILALQRRFSPEIDTSEIAKELGERLREELDYAREARHAKLYRAMLAGASAVRVPEIVDALSTERLLTMTWLDGAPLLSFREYDLDQRNLIATALFTAWWNPFARFGVIHGDPHLGNYTVFSQEAGSAGGATGKQQREARSAEGATGKQQREAGSAGGATGKQQREARSAEGATGKQGKTHGKKTTPAGINLLDFGCVRVFPPRFVAGVVGLYQGFLTGDEERIVAAYRAWGFRNLDRETIDTLNIWARFIYAPLLDDRVRTIADGVAPHAYGRREVWQVKQRLKPLQPVTVPREFVLLDRAAIGLGAVMLHLRAELNFHRLFEETIADFDEATLAERQRRVLDEAGLARRVGA